MHKVDIKNSNIRTDLILEAENKSKIKEKMIEENTIKIIETESTDGHYTSIEFPDITDSSSFKEVEKILIKELKKYVQKTSNDRFLIIGLGNPKSTPDSLGPKTLDEIIVTRYLFLLGEVDAAYSNVAIYKPNVCGNTGIESVRLIKKVIEEIKPTKVIAIDALKASHLKRLSKVIQITDTGIHPGSGILNDQGEISSKTMNCKVIAIGIPTVVDKNTMTQEESNDNFMVTPTNIDFLIERLSKLLGSSINKVVHSTSFDK